MFTQYIGDINEFPALGSPSPQKPKSATKKPTYASTTANGPSTSSFLSNKDLGAKKSITPEFTQRLPSSSPSFNALQRKSNQSPESQDFESFVIGNEQPSRLGHIKKDDVKSNRSPPLLPVQEEKDEQFGLIGLLGVLRMISGDKSMLALGSDLSTLGLNLNTSSELYSTFLSPWADTQDTPRGVLVEPGFHLPRCYQNVSASPPAPERMETFSDETLFYAFYSTPRDRAHVAAGVELQRRNWRYNKELGLWITRGQNDNRPFKKPDSGELSEQGVFTFFDPEKWEKLEKEWIVQWDVMVEISLEEEKLMLSTLLHSN